MQEPKGVSFYDLKVATGARRSSEVRIKPFRIVRAVITRALQMADVRQLTPRGHPKLLLRHRFHVSKQSMTHLPQSGDVHALRFIAILFPMMTGALLVLLVRLRFKR